jgi:hypothetical protein
MKTSDHARNRRARVEGVVAVLSALLAMVTLVWPQWIELLTGADPDGGNGSLEWAVVGGLAAIALVSSALALREVRTMHRV